jgi:FAD/FMN-containing dehydrogenase
VNEAAGHFGLRLPPDPSSGRFCTIGGMVATNASGARTLKYGSIRRWIHGVEFVTADGEAGWVGRKQDRARRRPAKNQRRVLAERLAAEDRFDAEARATLLENRARIRQCFPAGIKNSSGYALDAFLESGDLVDLIIGSEGTLGFITRAELNLDFVPGAVSAVLLAIADVTAVGDIVTQLSTLDPSAIELLDRTFLDFAAPDAFPLEGVDAVLLVEFERGTADAARGVVGDAVRVTRPWCVHVETALDATERERMWELRRGASSRLAELPTTRRSLQIVEDGCVPVDALGEYVVRVREAAKDAKIEIVAFGHAGDGNLHVNALVDTTEPDFHDRLRVLLDRVTDIIVALRGTVSGEHGDGRLRAPLLERMYGAHVLSLFGMVKDAFDPAGILNPGVIIGGSGAEPLADLKVGPAAADIPEPIRVGLLDMERRGGWATPKLQLSRDMNASSEPVADGTAP